MKIQCIELRHVKLEHTYPFETSFGRFTERHLVVLRVFSDIGTCYAEAPSLIGPFFTYETTQTTLHILKDFAAPAVLQQEITSIEDLHQRLAFIRGHNIAKSGVDTAFYHLMAAHEGKSLAQYLGGSRLAIDVGISIGIEDDLDALLRRVDWALQKGYRRIKIKIKPGWDLEPVRLIRQQFGDVSLMVDANSAFTLEHMDLLKQLDRYNLLMIEQPLGFDDIYEHSLLQKQLHSPICLDESIESYADAQAAVGIGACRIINIKLSRVGGLYPAIRIHDLCAEHGLAVWSGGMFESAIGKADSTALATLPNFTLPADIAPSDRYFVRDLTTSSLVLEDGRIQVPTGPGMGLEVDEEFLKDVTIEGPIVLEAK